MFLLADRELTRGSMTIEVAEMVDEFVWLLEDTADFVAGRVLAAIHRYQAQLLPPYARVLANYARLREHSWSAPGHQGGIAFTKHPAGRAFFDFLGENVFRTIWGSNAVFWARCSTIPVRLLRARNMRHGSSGHIAAIRGGQHVGANRSIMQACMKESDLVVLDRNCHKSIEQGLMLTGARPVYMVPTRNRYGIIGPISPSEMDPKTIRKKAQDGALTKSVAGQKPVYAVVTNSTYDGLCYNAVRAEALLQQSSDRIHFDEAWYGYARFNPMYATISPCVATRRSIRGQRSLRLIPPTSCSRRCRRLPSPMCAMGGAIDHHRFNQAYMMHTTTSPLYAIVASNDITSAMMDGSGGRSLTQEAINEAVDFRQVVGRMQRTLPTRRTGSSNPGMSTP